MVKKHLAPVAEIYAYVLLPNHFHFLVRIKSEESLKTGNINNPKSVSLKFGNLFNAYAKAINKRFGRVSSLFEDRFERIPVTSDTQMMNLICYIHWNPQKHRYISDFRKWEYSSYNPILKNLDSFVCKKKVLDFFSDKDFFVHIHEEYVEDQSSARLDF